MLISVVPGTPGGWPAAALIFRRVRTGFRRINRYAGLAANVNKKSIDKVFH